MTNNSQKGFVAALVIVVLAVIVGGMFVGYYFVYDHGWKKVVSPEMMKEDGTMMKDEKMREDDAMMKKDGETMMKYSGAVLAGKSALLLDFKKADYDAAVKSDKLVVLYFYANWCPICKREFPVMQEVFNGLITEAVVGFRVNYNDNETDADEKALARQFGVAYQHTKVFVKNGQRILKSPEGWDNKRYGIELSKSLTQ